MSSEIFRASLARVARIPGFFDRFRDRFLVLAPETQRLFQNRDGERIKQKFRMTLQLVAARADGEPGLDMYLQMLGATHRRLDIPPQMFGLWRQALLETATEADPQFDARTRLAWEQAVDRVMEGLRLG